MHADGLCRPACKFRCRWYSACCRRQHVVNATSAVCRTVVPLKDAGSMVASLHKQLPFTAESNASTASAQPADPFIVDTEH